MNRYSFTRTGDQCKIFDKVEGVECVWTAHRYNDTNKLLPPSGWLDKMPADQAAMYAARVAREIADHVARNYYDLVF